MLFKLSNSDTPDTARMNKKVLKMIEEALGSDEVELIEAVNKREVQNIFDDAYLERLKNIELPNTKIKLLQKLLKKKIMEFKKINQHKAIQFAKKFEKMVEAYNNRDDNVLVSSVWEDFTKQILNMIDELKNEESSYLNLGVTLEEKAFYDILNDLCIKYDIPCSEHDFVELAKKVRELVDNVAKYPAWQTKSNVRDKLYFDLLVLLKTQNYPPLKEGKISGNEIYKEVFEQAVNYKKNANPTNFAIA
jgi:type I restriction enzyme R subunit